MANRDDLRTVAGKALADKEFRQKMMEDPVAAVKEAGFDLSDEQLKALAEMDKEQLDKSLSDLDERLSMACWMRSASSTPTGDASGGCAWL